MKLCGIRRSPDTPRGRGEGGSPCSVTHCLRCVHKCGHVFISFFRICVEWEPQLAFRRPNGHCTCNFRIPAIARCGRQAVVSILGSGGTWNRRVYFVVTTRRLKPELYSCMRGLQQQSRRTKDTCWIPRKMLTTSPPGPCGYGCLEAALGNILTNSLPSTACGQTKCCP